MTDIINSLPLLERDTGARLPMANPYSSITAGQGGFALKFDNQNLYNIKEKITSKRQVRTFRPNDAFMKVINNALGTSSYPILIATISTVGAIATAPLTGGLSIVALVGAISFTGITTVIDLSQKDSGFRARIGDELWVIEQIGRSRENKNVAMHVTYVFLVDPFRTAKNFRHKGWLLHEMRKVITIKNRTM